ncbi:hypothetical protein KZO83_07440 [Chromohalobacter sp. TMW 2.2308]|uniref:hypothetical protein n=1 Tax=Chromohalobacter TaxID=42054 RepID=UPI001FFCC85C|nr:MULTISPECIES: hypothetical protein [Chromohalobacter]MCK2042521.1 hypothetical protein [Chromohalobacter moromii]MCT8514960.1 hypothetical protein [Chromohalobacter sp. TMW 2.2271]
MRLIDQLLEHPLFEEQCVKRILEPLGFEVHVECQETPDRDEEPENTERFEASPEAYMAALTFEVPEGFTELARFDTEDCEIVMVAVKPTTALAELLLAQEETATPLAAIATERRRQVESEGWTPEHDNSHAPGILATAGAFYAMHGLKGMECAPPPAFWPWHDSWWKPGTARRNLEKAGALTLAEIERLQRQAEDVEEQMHEIRQRTTDGSEH